jgi:amino acid adenylation domain-containing protein
MTTIFSHDTASRKDAQVFPTSFAQRYLWFLDQLEPDRATYNVPITISLRGLLDVSALERSLNAIMHRHTILRTTFTTYEGQPVQVVAPTLTMSLPLVDLRDYLKTEREVEAVRLVMEEMQRPFNLTQGPLVRATLLRLNEKEYVLLLITHRIVFDDWSTNVLIRELAALYESFSVGKPSPLPDLSIQYADYASWQRERLQGDAIAAQLSYWKQQLSQAPATLQLPTDYPRPVAQTLEDAQQSLVLSATLVEALQALSRQEGVTLFMIVLAAFQILIQRYTGQEDLVVGSSLASRQQAEVKELIGPFANTLPLRTNLSGNPSFRELLRRVQEVILEASAHADLPFEQLAKELQFVGNPNRPSTFDVMINFINASPPILEVPGLTIGRVQNAEPETKVPLTLYVEAQESELKLYLAYQRSLFSSERIVCMLDQLQYLLEQIVAAPEKSIQLYSLVTPQSLLLLPDPRNVLPEPKYELISTLFAAWVNRAPEQPAVCQDNRTWTYQGLAKSAYYLARFLLTQGLDARDVVAIVGQQSFGLIVSMMAVLLSGGVMLPIDWNLPARRQQLMLGEAGAKYLLYIGSWRPEDEWMQNLSSLVILRVDPDKGLVVEPKSTLDIEGIQLPALHPDDPAYIFFTSGTTGIPKGVLGCHKGLSHFLNWQRETFGVGPQDRCAQLTNLSFDAVLRDIFLPLTSGGTLCLPKESSTLSPDQILLWLEREQISLLHTVPSRLQSWLTDIPSEASLHTLRCVFFSGEPLTDGLINRWRETFPLTGEIVNLYGPTETTLVKCFYRVPPTVLPGVQPAGWPQPETQALVLTEASQLCGIGELGEIVLRTPFRSLGYINAPEENRKRFIKNPFRDDEEDLLYRTGDRGRYRLDGSLEILGRLDHQVKIRGVRVEPDEVMAILQRHPAVRQAVVVAREDVPGDKRLVAYIVTTRAPAPASSELRSFLREELPDYMLPSAFVCLEALPLMPNGKVDRRALPAPDTVRTEHAEDYVAPQTPTEEIVASIWAQVLHLERVGIHDNFFDRGGHSLLATQIIARLRETFQVELPLQSFFQAPTVAQMAEVVTQMQARGAGARMAAPRPRSREAYRVSSTLPMQGHAGPHN